MPPAEVSWSTNLAAGALAGLAVAMPIGAIGSYLIGLAARVPWRSAAAAALGVATTDGLYAAVAGLGGSAVAGAVGAIEGPLRILAVAALVVLAGATLRSAWRSYRTPAGGTARGTDGRPAWAMFWGMVTLTAVNPATLITFSAVVLARSGGTGPDDWRGGLVFAVGAFAASAAWQLVLAGGGSLLGRVLSGRRGRLAVAVASAVLMLGLAAAVVLG